MQFVYFTKYDAELNPEELGTKVKELGFDGMDLAVRPGHALNPDNVTTLLPEAKKMWDDMGLSIGIVTSHTRFTDPHAAEAEPLYAACAEAGVPFIKLGYWKWQGEDYWKRVDEIRKALDGFGKLSETYGVKTCHHTHSYGFYGSNCSGAMHLLKGMDPELFGVYLDTGHMFLDGEIIPFGLAIIREYLALVACKDLFYVKENDKPDTTSVPAGKGFMDWEQIFQSLFDIGFDGTCSIHAEYEGVDLETHDRMAADDLKYIKDVVQTVKDM